MRSTGRRLGLSALLLATQIGCGDEAPSSSGPADATVTVTIFHTSDEHGWLLPDVVSQPGVVRGGAANLRGWLTYAGFAPDEHLLLSSGDNWSGPAVSTWVEGESTVEVMNAMGYSATAIGNHEFDFDLDALAARVGQADYAHLSANVETTAGDLADFTTPYVVVPAGGVSVGVIGLTTQSSSTSAHPRYVGELDFTDYADVLATYVPQARDDGAEVIVVLAHVCANELVGLALESSVDIDLALGGHCHQITSVEIEDVPVVESGAHFGGFSRIDLTFDTTARTVVSHAVTYTDVAHPEGEASPVPPDAEIASVVESWQDPIAEELSEEVGYSSEGFADGSWKRANWVVDSWLAEYPQADVAVLNGGGLRQPIGPGTFTIEEMVGLMPFKNMLYTVDITGAALQANIEQALGNSTLGGAAVGGMTYRYAGEGVEITLTGPEAFDPDATYTVLITDYFYFGGAGYDFASYDDSPVDLGVHMRDPVISWTQALMTSASDPVDDHVDDRPRNQ